MNRFLLTILLLFAVHFGTIAQGQSYNTENNILYRDSVGLDEYALKNCRLDVYYPEGVKDFATMIWIHGGSLKGGKKELPAELKNRDFAVVAIEYRLTPKVKTPQCIDDAAAATAWVFNNIERFGGDKSKIYIGGHSAGGYLLMMIGYDKKYLAKYDIDADQIKALISYSGQMITHFTNRAERGMARTQPLIDEYAPLYFARADAPPTILITGGRDIEMLGRYEENAYMWRVLQMVKHPENYLYELQGFNHGGMMVPAHGLAIKYINSQKSTK